MLAIIVLFLTLIPKKVYQLPLFISEDGNKLLVSKMNTTPPPRFDVPKKTQ